ncbi:MAG TPA: hypothetical protein VFI25_02320 [Planctomycetota bacterium]|nr:hypothetical protein [Planctomycetota bacterium]
MKEANDSVRAAAARKADLERSAREAECEYRRADPFVRQPILLKHVEELRTALVKATVAEAAAREREAVLVSDDLLRKAGLCEGPAVRSTSTPTPAGTMNDAVRKSASEWDRRSPPPLHRQDYDDEAEVRACEVAGIRRSAASPAEVAHAVTKAVESGDPLYAALVLAARAAAPSPLVDEGDEADPCVALAKAYRLVGPDATDDEARAAAGRVIRDEGHPAHTRFVKAAQAGSARDSVALAREQAPVERVERPDDPLVLYVKRAGLVGNGDDPDAVVGRVLRDEKHPNYQSLIDVLAAEGALPRRRR